MPTLLLEQAPALGEGLEHDPRRGLGGAVDTGRTGAHGRLTLDELITSVWEGLAVRGTVSCPICAAPMVCDRDEDSRDEFRSGDRDLLAGICSRCGARLS